MMPFRVREPADDAPWTLREAWNVAAKAFYAEQVAHDDLRALTARGAPVSVREAQEREVAFCEHERLLAVTHLLEEYRDAGLQVAAA